MGFRIIFWNPVFHGETVMKFRIIFNCETCDGTGEQSVTTSGVDRNGPWVFDEVINCRECGGHGEGGMYTAIDLYETVDQVVQDYPEYRSIEPLGNPL